jgi:Tfp pilus assembly protein PilO
MSHRTKSLIFTFLAVFLIVVLFFIIYRSSSDNNNDQSRQKKIEQIERDYQQQVRKIIVDYKKIMDANQITAENVFKIKQELLNSRVPTKFKDLHLDLVLALTRLEDSFVDNNQLLAEEGKQLINKTLANNDWLN